MLETCRGKSCIIKAKAFTKMDPSQVQSDSANNSHSLEEQTEDVSKSPATAGGAAVPGKDGIDVTDATGGQTPTEAPKPTKKSGIKAFWAKFNIYLMLFILVVVVAIGIVVATTIKSKQAAQTELSSKGLSQDDLKQLATTDVSVGSPKQLLTVQANAVFAGGVLVRSNLEVAGSLHVGGSLSLSDLTVSGLSQLGDAQVNTLSVKGALSLENGLSIKNGLSVTGSANFGGTLTAAAITTGSLQLNGDLVLSHHITAGGTIPNVTKGAGVGSGGTASLSGSDTSGSITINTGSSPPAGCFASVTFTQKFSTTPHVIITPVNASAAGVQYYITRTTAGFDVCGLVAAPAGQTFGFDYMVLG